MIVLTRSAARQFRLVARRGMSRPRGPAPPVRISAEGDRITLAAHMGDVVVVWRMSSPGFSGSGSLCLPLPNLERFEGNRNESVTLQAQSATRGSARWQVRDSESTCELELVDCPLEWPAEPEHLISLPPTFPQAMHDAGRTTARESGKYAFHGVQLRGKSGQVVATDGKQGLIQGGFSFPFTDDLLVPAVPLFGAKEVACERAISVGRTPDWLYLVIGPWQVWLRIDPEGRFPDVAIAIPRVPGTCIAIDEEDAKNALSVLSKLPDKNEEQPTVTLELSRKPAIRVGDGADRAAIEVPFVRSQCKGPEVLVVLNRDHLGRALAMGFREFRCPSPERPLVAHDGERTYLTATLDPKLAIPGRSPQQCATRETLGSPVRSSQAVTPVLINPLRRQPMPRRDAASAEQNGRTEPEVGELIDPLAEAEALRNALVDATQRAARLLAGLKQYRKERKSLQAAWSSLRGLNLGS